MLTLIILSLIHIVTSDCVCQSPAPFSSTTQPAWLKSLQQQRSSVISKINYNGTIYNNPSLAWTQTAYIQPQVHPYDRYFYDPKIGYTPDRFLNDLKTRYGGIDAILIWPTYTNIGIDDRNQFDYFRCMPGGLDGVKNITMEFKARGVRVLWPYNPWDLGTHREPLNDQDTFAKLLKQTHGDGFNGDTMATIPESFWNASLNVNYPLAFEPEGGGTDASLNFDTMGWGYWKYPKAPGIDRFKFITSGKFLTNICDRWARDKTNNLQSAWLSGCGYESWENVWGTWNGITPRDGEAIRRVSHMLRYFGGKINSTSYPNPNRDYLHSSKWIPYLPQGIQQDVYVSKFTLSLNSLQNTGTESAVYTMVNRGGYNLTNVQQLWLPLLSTNVTKIYDCYHGIELIPHAPHPRPSPPLPIVPKNYNLYPSKNAYVGHGASKDIDNNPIVNQTVEQCTARCDSDASCSCVTYRYAATLGGGDCWKRAQCEPFGFDIDSEYNVYTKSNQYITWNNLNACVGHGASKNIDVNPIANQTVEQCTTRCDSDASCSCVTYLPVNGTKGDCWKRAGCIPPNFASQSNVFTYVKQSLQPKCPECDPVPIPIPTNVQVVSFDIEAGGYGCVVTVPNTLPNIALKEMSIFLNEMNNMTKNKLHTFNSTWKYLQQKRIQITKTPRVSAGNIPKGTVYIPKNQSWTWQVAGVMIEGDDAHGVDVQQPWDNHPHRTHNHVIEVDHFYMDIFPVTTSNYSDYLVATKYIPKDSYRFLLNWNGSLTTPPNQIKNVPVTYVSLDEARAYCHWRKARLPHEYEWQYAAQGTDGRLYPWGNTNDLTKYPHETTGTVYQGPEPVNMYSAKQSASPFGVRDLVGNVWQYTDEFQDDHTRAIILRGGSNYRPTGSQWYFPQAKQNNQHEKYFLMNERYERAGTIGFRCVQDV